MFLTDSQRFEAGVTQTLMPGRAVESDGLTLLDTVKHAVRTVSATLEPQDRLCIVTYATDASIALPCEPPSLVSLFRVIPGTELCLRLGFIIVLSGVYRVCGLKCRQSRIRGF